jgi:hypothetical protein
MKRISILLSLALCAACDPDSQFIRPDVPAELLEPVPVPDRPVTSNRAAALLLVDYDEALAAANGKIAAIGEIVGPR